MGISLSDIYIWRLVGLTHPGRAREESAAFLPLSLAGGAAGEGSWNWKGRGRKKEHFHEKGLQEKGQDTRQDHFL